jgi:hypothetical protein
MSKTPDMIGRYAYLSVVSDGLSARGQPVPWNITQEMQHIATMAKARLSPQQMRDATTHVEHAKLRLMNRTMALKQHAIEEAAEENANRAVKTMTAGMFGQPGGATKAQLDAYLNGQPIPSQIKRRPTEQELDAAFRSFTRQNDPKGVGWGKKETERRMDELADASPSEFVAIVQREGYRKDMRTLQQATSQWRGERIEQGLIERRAERSAKRYGEPEEKELVPNDRDKRRAVLVQSYLDTTADAIDEDTAHERFSETADDFAGLATEREMQEPGRRGALARAWNDQLAAGEE